MRKPNRRDLIKQAAVLGVTLPIAITAESAPALASTGTVGTEFHPVEQNRPVLPQGAPPESASFIDPTVMISGAENITLGQLVYIAPFARLFASCNAGIHIGAESNVQDNVTIFSTCERDHDCQMRIAALDLHDSDGVQIGKQCILAHGATVKGPAILGAGSNSHPQVFLSFGAEVDGAILEQNTQVSQLGRVGPGVRLRSGFVVLPGKNVTTQEEADNIHLGKVRLITEGDIIFAEAVIEVNISFAHEYTRLFYDRPSNVRGINFNPGHSNFNEERSLPTLDGVQTRVPSFRNRIIGAIHLDDTLDQLSTVMGERISLRADEGTPFLVGHVHQMEDNVIFHALEHTDIHIGNNVKYGEQVLVHGGVGTTPDGRPLPTVVDDNVTLKDQSIVFQSHIGSGCVIGEKSAVLNTILAPGTVIPDRVIFLKGAFFGAVEW